MGGRKKKAEDEKISVTCDYASTYLWQIIVKHFTGATHTAFFKFLFI